MNFAVVKFGGKQHLVSQGSQIEVNGNLGKAGDKVKLEEVLLLCHDGKISIGTPLVEKAVVAGQIVASGKGEKVRVAKFKSKVRYRKVIGFRPLITTINIVSVGDAKVSDSAGQQPAPRKGRTSKSSKV